MRTAAYCLACGAVATLAGTLASLPFDGTAAVVAWAGVGSVVAFCLGLDRGTR